MPQLEESLAHLLRAADYDSALDRVSALDLEAFIGDAQSRNRLRVVCMISDVLDYAGRYSDAKRVIENAGQAVVKRLSAIRKVTDISDLDLTKQECWALMMWGMSFYRGPIPDYDKALQCFKTSERVLTLVHREEPSYASLARAAYCVGLVERQNHQFTNAKNAFSKSIELAGDAVEDRRRRNRPFAALEYHIARCSGLGIGWIAWAQADLAEANSALVVAQLMMRDKRARFMHAYVNLIRACVILSGCEDKRERVDEAIDVLKNAYASLQEQGAPHIGYAMRAAVDLARAYTVRSRLVSKNDREECFRLAESYIQIVEARGGKESRAHCEAFIARSRLERERGDQAASLRSALAASMVSAPQDLMHLSPYIAMGEAQYENGLYAESAQTLLSVIQHPAATQKLIAVSQLHLCRGCLKMNQPGEAVKHFRVWQAIERGIENSYISEFAKKVKAEMEAELSDFKIDSAADLNPATHVGALRYWLARTALRRAHDDEEEARKMLQVSMPTLRTWLRGKQTT